MTTIIIGTNRPDSRARQVALLYAELLGSHGAAHQLLDLADLPPDFTAVALYANAGRHDGFNQLFDLTNTADKLVFVVPEYRQGKAGHQ